MPKYLPHLRREHAKGTRATVHHQGCAVKDGLRTLTAWWTLLPLVQGSAIFTGPHSIDTIQPPGQVPQELVSPLDFNIAGLSSYTKRNLLMANSFTFHSESLAGIKISLCKQI